MSFDIVEHTRRVAWLADLSEEHFRDQLRRIVSTFIDLDLEPVDPFIIAHEFAPLLFIHFLDSNLV